MKRVNENPPARFPVKPLDEYSLPWWVAKIKPRQEKALAFDFIAKNIEYYLPLLTKVTRRKDNNKPRKSIIPLFPGYISFCADKNDLRTAFSTGRVVNTIEIRHQKRFVEELMQIFAILDIGMPIEPCVLDISEGTMVCVQSGPMQGLKGIVSQVQNQSKLILSVESLGQAAIAVDVKTVKPV